MSVGIAMQCFFIVGWAPDGSALGVHFALHIENVKKLNSNKKWAHFLFKFSDSGRTLNES